jgi:hypothetical protein
MVKIAGYAGVQIRSFRDWENHALPPTRRKKHWKEGRSACELGRRWTADGEPRTPPEILQILESNDGTRGTVILSGITEHETLLPYSNGGPRCHDLALLGIREGSPFFISIEAKADESFGGTVSEELRKARRRPETRFPKRLDWLTRSLLGIAAFKDQEYLALSEAIAPLQYQLFSGIAGVLLEAQSQNATRAIFLVHEFRTAETHDGKLEKNATTLGEFVRLLLSANNETGCDAQTTNGWLIGPISITDRDAGGPKLPSHIPLFIGKLRTDQLNALA